MIEIESYEEQPPGKATIAIFTAYLPAAKMRIRKLRLLRLKTGHYKLGMPSYALQGQQSFAGQEKLVWEPYIEFSQEKQKDFEEKALEALKPFIRS